VKLITTLLIANRGEIARRIIRTARTLGIRTVAVYSDVDAGAPHVTEADLAVNIGGRTSAESYLAIDKILAAMHASGADAVHPGYGFLSENAAFVEQCEEAGITFVGPSAKIVRDMGLKDRAKDIARAAGVPVLPDALLSADDHDRWLQAETSVGLPLLVKAAAGGGGRGMRLVRETGELIEAVTAAQREAMSSFGNAAVFLERYLDHARHIEIQIFGDSHGLAVHLGERECSIQRRYQKIVEESPSAAVSSELRDQMGATAIALVRKLGYVGAGTVEYLLDDQTGEFYFLEMNTRLQVEHAVTEEVTGLDLVALQLRVAQGEPLDLGGWDGRPHGHAIEVRLYAEDPAQDCLPSPGHLLRFQHGGRPGIRFEDGVVAPCEVSPYYDPMLAKIISFAPTRSRAAAALATTLDGMEIHGVTTNREMLAAILRDSDFLAGDIHTGYIDQHRQLLAPSSATDPLVHLAAAIAASVIRRRSTDVVTGHAPAGYRTLAAEMLTPARWRTIGGAEITLAYRLETSVEPMRLHIELDGRKLAFDLIDACPESVRVRHQAVEYPCTVRHYPDGSLWVNDTKAQSSWVPQPRLPEHNQVMAGTMAGCTSAMPGTVTSVKATVGERVIAGQPLVIVEAMKMEHETRAHMDGVIERVHVSPGDYVEAGRALVTILSEPPG
jgi:acetyl/propionyl-CoA carboxylase alpha subunit